MKIVFAVFGSLGDMHPMNALGLELKRRGHQIIFAAMEFYREKIETLGFEFRPMRPDLNPEDKELARRVMEAKTGTELLLKEILSFNDTLAKRYKLMPILTALILSISPWTVHFGRIAFESSLSVAFLLLALLFFAPCC